MTNALTNNNKPKIPERKKENKQNKPSDLIDNKTQQIPDQAWVVETANPPPVSLPLSS